MGRRVHDVAVIGAGPYGLSAAAHLRARGLGVAVIGHTMSSWQQAMPAGMLLRSERLSSTISAPAPGATLADFVKDHGWTGATSGLVPVERFVDYGTWFARERVPDICADEVRRLAIEGHYLLELESGSSLRAHSVVIATGHRAHARWPAALEHVASQSKHVSHASHHSDLSVFRGKRVAVIGAGQSALETAALLHEAGACPVLIVRGAAVQWDLPPDPPTRLGDLRRPPSGLGRGWHKRTLEHHAELVRPLPTSMRHRLLGTVLGPSGAYWLRERVEPHVEIRTGSEVDLAEACADGVRLRLVDGERSHTWVEADHVIAATGYRFDLDRLGYLDSDLRTKIRTLRGFPRLSTRLESSMPRLHFTGLAAGGTFGPVMRFVCGTAFASPRIAHAITRESHGAATARRTGQP